MCRRQCQWPDNDNDNEVTTMSIINDVSRKCIDGAYDVTMIVMT